MELSGERCRGEEVRGRVEGEVQEMRERLREKTDKLVAAEDALLASRQQVHRHIIPCSLEPLNNRHIGMDHFVHREAVLPRGSKCIATTVESLIKDTLNKGHLCISNAPTYIAATHFYLKKRTTSL